MAERLIPDYTLLIELFIFLVLLLVLTKYLFKPFLKILERRRTLIDGTLQEAQRVQQKIGQMMEEYNLRISEARRESAKILEDLKREGEEVGKEIIDKARLENERQFEESKKKIWQEARELEKKLEDTAEEVSNELTSKILK